MEIIKEERFDFTVRPNETVRGFIHVNSGGEEKLRVQLYSDHTRITTEKDRFIGIRFKIGFTVETEGLDDGDVIDGAILIASDRGEFTVPVRVVISSEEQTEEITMPSDLKAFAACAQDDIGRAVRVFSSKRFPELFPADEPGLAALYRGLRRQSVSAQAVEEFLVGAALKLPVNITLDSEKIGLFEVRRDIQETITLRRDTWGSVAIELSTDADFIHLPARRLTDHNFVGSICHVQYQIRADRLGAGFRTGRIRIRFGTSELWFDVTASSSSKDVENPVLRRDELKIELEVRAVNRMLRLISEEDYADDTIRLLDSLAATGEEPAIENLLLKVRMLETVGRRPEAVRLLEELKSRERSDWSDVQCLYLAYCEILCGLTPSAPDSLGERARSVFMCNRTSLNALELVFLTDRGLQFPSTRRLRHMEAIFNGGSRSAYLYAMVLFDLHRDDKLLVKLTPLMIQVLVFAARKKMLTKQLVFRTASLMNQVKEYSPCLCEVLTTAYEIWPSEELLKVIVRYLLNGNAYAPSSFVWYEKALEANLTIVGLYERYVETLPETKTETLPAQIRSYFLYGNTLSDSLKAMIYANIVRNQMKDPVSFSAYREKMSAFAKKKLAEERLSPDFAVLYQTFCDRITDAKTADRLLKVLFTVRIYSDDKAVRSVVVVHRELKQEQVVPLIRGVAYVSCFTRNAQILLEDGNGRRYSELPYRAEPLMEREPFFTMCREKTYGDEGLWISECERFSQTGEETREALRAWRAVEQNRSFTDEFRGEVRGKILHYLLRHPEDNFFGAAVSDEEYARYAAADKSALIRILLSADLRRKAYELILRFGPDGIDPDALVELAGGLIEENGGEFDKDLGIFAGRVLRTGKADARIISYLEDYYTGSLPVMLEIRRRAIASGLPTATIDMRILDRSFFTGEQLLEGPEVLTSYLSGDPDPEVVKEYLGRRAEHLLATDDPFTETEANAVMQLSGSGETPGISEKLVLLRYFSTKEKLTEQEASLTEDLLDEMTGKNIRLSFFKELPSEYVLKYQLEDKVFAEVRANPEDDVVLEYTLTGGSSLEEAKLRSETMKSVYRGIFSREFTLFYGEELQYTIRVSCGGEEVRTERGTLTSPETDVRGRSAYQRINAILAALSAGNEEEAGNCLEDHLRAVRASEVLFHLEEE